MLTSLFQFIVRTAVTSGAGSRTLLPKSVRGLGGRRAVLFTDRGLTKVGITAKIVELFSLMPEGVQLVGVFDEIEQDAKASIINKATKYFNDCAGDSLIALGGGSVLDSVKSIKWMLSKELTDIRHGLSDNIVELWPKVRPIPIPHVAIPTTAGTGAEVSPIAVIFHDELQIKMNVVNPFINADIALLDPELTVELPPYITAFTGFDALTHAIEGYFSPHSNPMADAFALQSVRMITQNLATAVDDGHNLAARANMLIASTMGIYSFGLTLSAVPVHNMAHAFGAKFGIPHGLANAVLLPSVMNVLASMYLPRTYGMAEAFGLKDVSNHPQECFDQVVSFIRQLREQVGIPNAFSEFQMDPKVLDNMVDVVHADPSGVGFRIPDKSIQQVVREVAI